MVALKRMPRIVAVSIAGLLLTPAATLGWAASAAADPTPTFDGFANAYGVDVTVYNASLPLGLTVEGAGPVAQAHMDSVGTADAFASMPYPGDTVQGLPGLAGALFGNLPTPAYPLILATSAGDGAKDSAAPGIAMHAESGTGATSAQATFGAAGAGSTSTARVEKLADNSVKASATNVSGFNLLNLISISGVQSSATVTASSYNGALTRESHLSIGEISIAGLSMTIPPTTPGTIPIPVPVPGLPTLPSPSLPVLPIALLGGQTLPIPNLGFEDGTFTVTLPLLGKTQKYALPSALVLSAFKSAGFNVSYQQAENTQTGVIAPALSIKFTLPAPPPNNPTGVSGSSPVEIAFGRTTASVTLHPVLSSFSPGSLGLGSSSPGQSTSGQGTFTNGGSGAVTSPATPLGGGGSGAGALGAGGLIPGTGTAVTPAGGTGSPDTGGLLPGGSSGTQPLNALPAASIKDVTRADLSGIYLLGVLVAAAALGGGLVIRMLGVRLLWGS